MNKVATELYMVFDVESVGLHGEGFSVGWYVIDGGGKRVASAQYACDPDRAEGSDEDRKWVAENIPVPRQGYNCSAPRFVRDEFWRAWMYAKQRGAVLAADVPWPVEARFLAQCIDDDQSRKWDGPYPIIDIASVRFAAGLDPLEAVTRNSDELPQHDPLCDSRQSARLLTELLSHRTAPAPGMEEVDALVESYSFSSSRQGCKEKFLELADLARRYAAALTEEKQRADEVTHLLRRMLGAVITVRLENTPEWMEYMAEVVNEMNAAIGDADRVETHGDGIRIVRLADSLEVEA